MPGTKFIKLKRCIDCWHENEWERKTCSLCGKLFISEASPEEIEKANKDLIERKEKAKNAFIVEID
jgi:predicted amidophosphoribosyltransferase